ncbi:MAG: thioredoxin [Gemmataceae bacterium]|nr:thioredoxin [Gemmataceae bacterium]
MSKSAYVFDVSEAEFAEKVLQKSKETPVVVDFWAPWCGPCRMLAPLLEAEAAARRGEVLVAKVNTDVEQGLALKYAIEALPTVIAFKNGEPVLDFMGLLSPGQLKDFFDRVAPTAADRQQHDAAQLEATDPEQAEQLYRRALQSDPRHEPALVGLARLLVRKHQDDEAAQLLENVGASGEHGAEAERLGAIIWLRRQAAATAAAAEQRRRTGELPSNAQVRYDTGLREAQAGNYAAALEHLLTAGELDPKLAAGPVREAMVKIFQIVGVRSPLADEYRAKLSALLY